MQQALSSTAHDVDCDGFPVMMRVPQVCEKLHVTRFGLHKLAKKRADFPKPLKIGRELHFYRAEVLAWMSGQRVTRVGGGVAQ